MITVRSEVKRALSRTLLFCLFLGKIFYCLTFIEEEVRSSLQNSQLEFDAIKKKKSSTSKIASCSMVGKCRCCRGKRVDRIISNCRLEHFLDSTTLKVLMLSKPNPHLNKLAAVIPLHLFNDHYCQENI